MRIKEAVTVLTDKLVSSYGVIPAEYISGIGFLSEDRTTTTRARLILVELLSFLGHGGDNVPMAF